EEEAGETEATVAVERAEVVGAKLGAADERVGYLSARLEQAGFIAAVDRAEAARLEATARDLAAQARALAGAAEQLADVQARLDALDAAIAAAEKRLVELTEQAEAELRPAA